MLFFRGNFFPGVIIFSPKQIALSKAKLSSKNNFGRKFSTYHIYNTGGAINKQTKTTFTLISYMPDKIKYSFTLHLSLLNLSCVGWFKKSKGYLWFVFCSYETGSPFYLLSVYSGD